MLIEYPSGTNFIADMFNAALLLLPLSYSTAARV
jgi:hypothetical protein